jgi:hypothetical protein
MAGLRACLQRDETEQKMAKKSFFSKFFHDDDDEESVEDIDRRLAKELAAIDAEEVETLDGDRTMMEDWENAGACVYLMNLAPLYAIIGGRDSMLGKRLPDACDHIFERLVPAKEGRARIRGDYFVMSFVSLSRQNGFVKAAQVINGIGLQTIGERFKTIEVPNLLAAADPADLANENGEFDPAKAKAQLESGGSGVALSKAPEEPVWLKLSVTKANKAAAMVAAARGGDGDSDAPRPRRRGDPDWAEPRSDRRVRISNDPMQMERRRGRDRRVNG